MEGPKPKVGRVTIGDCLDRKHLELFFEVIAAVETIEVMEQDVGEGTRHRQTRIISRAIQ